MAGALYDHFGTYAPAFAAGVAANAVNLVIVGLLVFRQTAAGVAVCLTVRNEHFNLPASCVKWRSSRSGFAPRAMSAFGTVASDINAATVRRCVRCMGFAAGDWRRRHRRQQFGANSGVIAIPWHSP